MDFTKLISYCPILDQALGQTLVQMSRIMALVSGLKGSITIGFRVSGCVIEPFVC